MAAITSINPSFWQKGAEVLSNTDNIVEGAFWSAWCLFSTNQWREAYREKQKVGAEDLQPEEKVQKLWDTNKNFALASCSFASGISMVVSWLNEVDLLPLGHLGSAFGALGYGGSGITSGAKVIENFQALDQQKTAFFEAVDSKEKSNIALDIVSTAIKIAFFVSMASWGILGAAYSLYGGATLFVAQDTAFYYCTVTLLGVLGSLIVIPLAKKLP